MRRERAYSPSARVTAAPALHAQGPDPSRVLVIGCGALARELVAVIDQAGLANVDLTCLPATLHNRPGGIPDLVRARIRAARPRYGHVFVAYADCGTGGLLDRMLEEEGVERLPGAHCYESYSGSPAFEAMTDEDPATFFLTDFLARNFDRLVIEGLGLDRHPELLATYFGNYHRLVYLAQTDDPALVGAARRAAHRLGLRFELRQTGYGDLATSVVAAARAARAAPGAAYGEASGAETDAATGMSSGMSSGAGDRGSSLLANAVASLAPGASNDTRSPMGGTESAHSLRTMQEIGPRRRLRGQDLRLIQETGRRRPAGRRLLRPAQGRMGILHGTQETATAATRATATRATATAATTTATRATATRATAATTTATAATAPSMPRGTT